MYSLRKFLWCNYSNTFASSLQRAVENCRLTHPSVVIYQRASCIPICQETGIRAGAERNARQDRVRKPGGNRVNSFDNDQAASSWKAEPFPIKPTPVAYDCFSRETRNNT